MLICKYQYAMQHNAFLNTFRKFKLLFPFYKITYHIAH